MTDHRPRVLITQSDRYMGPAIAARFEELGYELILGRSPLISEQDIESLVADAGRVDIVVANFAMSPMTAPVEAIETSDWESLFSALVSPLMFLARAVVPQMKQRQAGKIIAITSAAPLKGIPNNTAYCAARGAQNSFIKALGMELARDGIQVNAIAQNYINNDTYYPDNLLNNEKFQSHVKRNVPTGQVGRAAETAALAAYLASDDCRHMVGQILPLAGGWTT